MRVVELILGSCTVGYVLWRGSGGPCAFGEDCDDCDAGEGSYGRKRWAFEKALEVRVKWKNK